MKASLHAAPANSIPAAGLACALATLLAATAQAANIYWEGGGADTLWSNVANWDTQANGLGGNPGAAPGASDTAYFNASTFGSGGNGALNVTFNTTASPGFSAAGMVFNNTGANTIANASGALRTVNLGSGGITLNSGAGGLSMGGTLNSTRYTINLTAAQTWTNNGSGTCAIANAPNSSAAVVQGDFLLTLDGSGNFSFGNGINNGSGGLTKNGAGTASINQQAGLSTGTGVYTINGGILDVTIFANGGSNSGLGASSAAAGNLVFGGGTLRHSAANVAGTDRLFTIGNAVGNTATLNSSAAAAANGLAFTGTGSILFDDTFSTTHTLTLTGSNTGAANTFAPVLGNSAGATSLIKSGAGTWALTGANTYTGSTTVNAGTLTLADNASLKFVLGAVSGTNNSISGAGTVTLDGDFVIDTTAADALSSGTWTIVDNSTLTETYGATFSVINGFTDAGGDKWTKNIPGSKTYTFDETTGILTLATAGVDTTPPSWNVGWPSVDTLTTTGCTVRLQTNENGQAYYVVLAGGAGAPSAAQVKAGQDSSGNPVPKSGSLALTANTEATAPVTGLSPGTAYDIWFVAEDAMPNLQTGPVKVSVTTSTSTDWITVSVPDGSAAEQLVDPGTIRISRGAATGGNLTVHYSVGGTAGSGDYSESYSGTATIPDGSSFVDLVFTPVDDSVVEGNETIRLDLLPNAGYTLGGSTSGSITVADNDAGAGYTAHGTPYTWLDLYGLVAGGDYEAADALDSDGDGKTNQEEFDGGTNPTGIAMPNIGFTFANGGVGGTDTLTFAPPNTGWVIEATDNGGADWGVLPKVSFTVDAANGTVTANLPKPAALGGGGTYRVTETRKNRKLVVFLSEGQSNMVGWSKKTSYDMDDYPCPNMFQLTRGHIRSQYDPGTANSFIRAFQPLQTTAHRSGADTDAYVSLDFYFAREFAKDHPDVDVLIVKNAQGSQGFFNGTGSFAEGKRLDILAEPYLSAAVTAVAGRYDTLEFGGLLWHQGEADAENEANSNAYGTQLKALIVRHRAAAESHIPGALGAPVIVGTMERDFIAANPPYSQTVDTVHRNIGTLVSNAACADLSSIDGPNVHFSADQYQTIGEWYYDTYRTLLNITRKGTSKVWLDSHGVVTGGDYEAADLRDSDFDGRPNWIEFRDGTNPKDPNSMLKTTNLLTSGNQLTLTWQAVAGKTYTLWYTPDLGNKAWIRTRTGLAGAEPSSSVNIQISGARGFYRFETEH